jgi:cysteine sulfinate desulfinase/cysteine desulfurase-like protein
MGIDPDRAAAAAIRLSVGRSTTEAQIRCAAKALLAAVKQATGR